MMLKETTLRWSIHPCRNRKAGTGNPGFYEAFCCNGVRGAEQGICSKPETLMISGSS